MNQPKRISKVQEDFFSNNRDITVLFIQEIFKIAYIVKNWESIK